MARQAGSSYEEPAPRRHPDREQGGLMPRDEFGLEIDPPWDVLMAADTFYAGLAATGSSYEEPAPRRHPDYDRWVKTWGKMHADDENQAWLERQRRFRERDDR